MLRLLSSVARSDGWTAPKPKPTESTDPQRSAQAEAAPARWAWTRARSRTSCCAPSPRLRTQVRGAVADRQPPTLGIDCALHRSTTRNEEPSCAAAQGWDRPGGDARVASKHRAAVGIACLWGAAWWRARLGWQSAMFLLAGQLVIGGGRWRPASWKAARCVRESTGCECAMHHVASHAASRRAKPSSVGRGGHP